MGGKPVCLKLLADTRRQKMRLESELDLRVATSHEDIIDPEVEKIIPEEALTQAGKRVAVALEKAISRDADAALIDKCSKLKRRLLCETTLSRVLTVPPKYTLGYIKYIGEIITSVEAENGNKFLVKEASAFRKKLESQRLILNAFEESSHLC